MTSSRQRQAQAQSRRVPEVLQSSLTDCGPAALKAVLEGFGVSVDYDLLRERCQTDVDGTSIDALGSLARELGVENQQILVPHDHFLLPEARCLPAIVVTRSGGGLLHFVVVWRRLGPFVEVLDPGSGRRWLHARRLLAEMPELPIGISAARWRRWAALADAQAAWRARLRALGVSARRGQELLGLAGRDPSWLGYARFDAALRMASALTHGRAFRRGREAELLLAQLIPTASPVAIPERFRWVRQKEGSTDRLITHGSVILRFSGRARDEPPTPAGRLPPTQPIKGAADLGRGGGGTESVLLPRAVSDALALPTLRPLRVLWLLMASGTGWRLAWLLAALSISAALVPVEALLLRALLDIDRHLSLGYQRLGWLLAVLVVVGVALLLDHWSGSSSAKLGRELETRLRAALLERLPALGDRYLRSRSSSDMASRGHSLHTLRALPTLWAQVARSGATVIAITLALVWFFPGGRLVILGLALVALAAPFLGRRSLTEQRLRLRTQAAALDRFYLDTLLGVTPVRVHGAQRSIQIAHEQLLTEWGRTARRLHRAHTAVQGLQVLATTGMAVALILLHLARSEDTTGLLLIAFLALRLPASANELTSAQLALENLRAVALRALAPLAAPLDALGTTTPAEPRTTPSAPGAALALHGVTVVAGGHELLRDITLEVPSGQHVAIVGASGAGKSSLLGILLGWVASSQGTVDVDGRPLDAPGLRALRGQTAWVDPAVHLWDRSLLDNLTYGDDQHLHEALPHALSNADLLELLERLPEGLQSNLGEGGAAISGGQGQRVRLGRALMRSGPRLVLLDEPFRGLTRGRRRELLRRARLHWRDATLLFVSHDVDDTSELDRVIVIDAGRVVEQGDPQLLLGDPCSRYARLTEAARDVRKELWGAPSWRRLELAEGRMSAAALPPPSTSTATSTSGTVS